MSEIFRCSDGTFGIRVNEVGWGMRGTPEQVDGCEGDCRTGCGGEGLGQTFTPLKTTSDLIERGGVVSSGAELAEESSS